MGAATVRPSTASDGIFMMTIASDSLGADIISNDSFDAA